MENVEIRKIGNCFNCGKEIYTDMDYVFGDGVFCSIGCSIDYLVKGENREIRKVGECFNCGKEIYNNMEYVYGNQSLFCSVKCDMEYYKKKYKKY